MNLRETRVEVFAMNGGLVFTGVRRSFAGHSSVELTLHANGGVRKIQTSSAPDGGIQWYKSSYELDEQGNIISFWEDSHDERPSIRDDHQMPVYELPATPRDDVGYCATPMGSQMILYNRSKRAIRAIISRNHQLAGITHDWVKLHPGDSLVSEIYIDAERFGDPNELFKLSLWKPNQANHFDLPFNALPSRSHLLSPQHKVYQLYWLGDL